MSYPYAIMDYGIGGMGICKMIQADFPELPILYFSDSGEVPYGKLPANVLRARIENVIAFLHAKGAKKIIVACHSASSVIMPTDAGVIDIRKATLDAVKKSNSRRVAILGGGRTIESGFYRDELEKSGIEVTQKVAQILSILVERGEVKSREVDKALQGLVGDLDGYDSILLACTHYPALIPEFKKHISEDIKLIDPADELYDSVRENIPANGYGKATSIFLTTGDAALMKQAALNAFGVKIGEADITRVSQLDIGH